MGVGPFPVATAVTLAVLVVVLVIGVAAGRAKGRWTLLAAGVVVLAAAGVVLTAVDGGPDTDDPGAELAALYTITVPLAIAFLAGWLLAHGSWLRRFLIVAAATLLLAVFPYAAAGQATADAFLGGG